MNKRIRTKKRILILGSGFGGIYTYINLHKQLHSRDDVEIIMISENDHFLFSPLLHEVAVGNLPPETVRQPARTMPECCLDRFITGRVSGLDFDNQTVQYRRLPDDDSTDDVLEEDTISYDYLVSSLGSDTSYYGTPGAEEHALPLKRLEHATAIKNRIIEKFESASTLNDVSEIRSALRFVIIGGGATGVEMAGELGDMIDNELKESFPKLCEYAEVHLYEGGERLVKGLDEWFSQKVTAILEKKESVSLHFNSRAKEVTPHGVQVNDEFVYADTTMWTAGVHAQELDFDAKKPVQTEPKTDRIHVTNELYVPEYPNVFVVGDQAWIKNKETGQPYPMRAQFAVREGKTAARNIAHLIRQEPLEEFYWRDKGYILSLGEGGALASVYGFHFSGIIAWWVYRLVYLMQIPGFRAKTRTLFEWIMNFFGPRDISRL